jgi:predicted GH43/DUF377 family glycosyl hydrolase
MAWRKAGLIYCPDGANATRRHSFMTPTPFLLEEDVVRLYGGIRDDGGVSRIFYIDVSAKDPSRVLFVSETPALDVGSPGTFDDNGVILGDVVRDGKDVRMYYVGFQKVEKAKFLAFTGCAVSRDGGDSFVRLRPTPVMDRSPEGAFIRAIHSVRKEGGKWRVYYSAGDGWETIGGVPYPRYHIRCAESEDGLSFPAEGTPCLLPNAEEYRIGRPRVHPHGNGYLMYFTSDTYDKRYRAGAALSPDGLTWRRDDALLGLSPSREGWDGETLCYPALLDTRYGTYLFYSGNGMGRTGTGYARQSGA